MEISTELESFKVTLVGEFSFKETEKIGFPVVPVVPTVPVVPVVPVVDGEATSP